MKNVSFNTKIRIYGKQHLITYLKKRSIDRRFNYMISHLRNDNSVTTIKSFINRHFPTEGNIIFSFAGVDKIRSMNDSSINVFLEKICRKYHSQNS